MRQKEAIPELTSIRGLAALAVLLRHLGYVFGGTFHAPPFSYGYLGVDAFFVLSGFLLAGRRYDSYSAFLCSRAARTLPTFLAAITIAAFIRLMIGQPFQSALAFTLPLLTVPWAPNDSIDVPVWSLATDWYVYLAFPVLLRLARHRYGMAISGGALVGFVLLMAFRQHGYIFGWTAILRASVGAVFGAALRNLIGDWAPNIPILRHPVGVWLGRVSYPLYLVQWPVITATVLLHHSWLGEAVAVGLILSIATVMHHVVEVPAQRWLRTLPQRIVRLTLAPGPSGAFGAPARWQSSL